MFRFLYTEQELALRGLMRREIMRKLNICPSFDIKKGRMDVFKKHLRDLSLCVLKPLCVGLSFYFSVASINNWL